MCDKPVKMNIQINGLSDTNEETRKKIEGAIDDMVNRTLCRAIYNRKLRFSPNESIDCVNT